MIKCLWFMSQKRQDEPYEYNRLDHSFWNWLYEKTPNKFNKLKIFAMNMGFKTIRLEEDIF